MPWSSASTAPLSPVPSPSRSTPMNVQVSASTSPPWVGSYGSMYVLPASLAAGTVLGAVVVFIGVAGFWLFSAAWPAFALVCTLAPVGFEGALLPHAARHAAKI